MARNHLVHNYERFLSMRGKRLRPSAIRALQPLMKIPGMISLGGGMPNPGLFPITKVKIETIDGDFNVDQVSLKAGLQYSDSYGLSFLKDSLVDLVCSEHSPPLVSSGNNNDWNMCITNGSQDGLFKAFDILADPGDVVLTEDPTYSGTLALMKAIGCTPKGIQTDSEGMIPSDLEQVLSSKKGVTPTRLVYIIPTGQNPSGCTTSPSRKKEIYKLACDYDLLILEDDPYYYLTLEDDESISHPKSFTSLDHEGRVLRFDSFSKIVSSGLRMGCVSGPAHLIEQIQLHQQCSLLHPSGLSQSVLAGLLSQWGREGWNKQLSRIKEFYRVQRDHMVSCLEKHVKGKCTWSIPKAGMFIWLKIEGIEDATTLIQEGAVTSKFLAVPGSSFSPQETAPSPFVRLSYSTATFDQMDEAISRLAKLIDEKSSI